MGVRGADEPSNLPQQWPLRHSEDDQLRCLFLRLLPYPGPQPARHQSGKRHTHTCIRIRLLIAFTLARLPVQIPSSICISFIVHLLDLLLLLTLILLFFCIRLHAWTKQTYVSEYFSAAGGLFFVSQN